MTAGASEQGRVAWWFVDRRYWLVSGAGVLAVLLFIGLAALFDRPGFPLDDAWIHQTYARNLAHSGRWQYVSGVVSAGSTAPLWTLLLALGYVVSLPYLLWAYLLGALCLLWLAYAAMQLWRTLWPAWAGQDWQVGLVIVATWPLVWAAASGMETLLFIALGVQILALYSQWHTNLPISPSPLLLGLLTGLLILTRPDGLVLLLLVAAGLFIGTGPGWLAVRTVGLFLGAAALPLLPYFAFNYWSSGHLWPNTFYAKQAEYAFLLAQPLPFRLARLLYFTWGGPETGIRGMSGAHLLLLPGLMAAGWLALRRDWERRQLCYILPLLWAGGHVLLYAWRLPVTYQHGRYLWAALPLWILYGWAGWQLLRKRPSPYRLPAVRLALPWSRVAGLIFATLLLIFLLLGAQAYATDVAFIQNEMVEVAHWLRQNTGQDALVAAHDIGAIGYFAGRPLLDLAGLISPEVIPLLTDELALAHYVHESAAGYLVTAPGWPYKTITEGENAHLLYTTAYPWTRQQGYNNVAVYRLEQR